MMFFGIILQDVHSIFDYLRQQSIENNKDS